ncbi:hypothetical protein D3C72_420460 [compost metagenome]
MHELIVEGGGLVPAQYGERLVQQIREPRHPLVAGGQHGDEMGAHHGQHLPALGGGQAAEAEIQPALGERQQLVMGGEIVELYADPGAAGPKTGDGRGHQQLGGDPEADAQGAAIARQHVAGGATELLALGHQGAGIPVEGAPEGGEPGAAGVALEQLAAKFPLQPPYLLAQGRLGDVLARRRLAKVQYLPQGDEGLQVSQLHRCSFIPAWNIEWQKLSLDGILELFDADANSF